MSKEEKFIFFLEERIKRSKSIRSNAAYTLVLEQFRLLFMVPEEPKLPSEEKEN